MLGDRDRIEYEALRATIRERGTARLWLFWTSLTAWGVTFLFVFAEPDLPRAAALVSLLILAAGFEAVSSCHLAVERIGRYLQAAFEETRGPGGPGWETTIMDYGRRYDSGGLDPLFTVMFALAALINVLAVVTGTMGSELAALIGTHALFMLRLIRVRRLSLRQGAEDLDRFRALLK